MIVEIFTALKAIGVSDQHILDVIEALESRHDEYRRDIHELKRDVALLMWAMVAMFIVLLPILFKVFSK